MEEREDEWHDPLSEELELLLSMVYEHTEMDFRNYCESMIQRRVARRLRSDGFSDLRQYLQSAKEQPGLLVKLSADFMIHVTEMFRDPDMFRCLRRQVFPAFRQVPLIRIWAAGCSTGEEVYSLAVLLEEAGLLSKCRIYATDLSPAVLQEARRGRFHPSKYAAYAAKYKASGGGNYLSDYVELRDDGYYYFRRDYQDILVFSPHDLTKDGVFHEFDLICCRNVMIYFNSQLKQRVNRLLFHSLKPGGALVIGSKESIRFTEYESHFRRVDRSEKIYYKMEKGGAS